MIKKLLIIEDETDIAEMIALRLRKEGFAVETVETGPRGLESVLRGNHDLVILDLMLPGMNGMEILKRVRAQSPAMTPPILILSAKGDEGDIVAGLELGADDYLTKPFQMAVLVARINALLRRVNMHAEQAAMPPRQMEVGPITIDPERYQVFVEGEPITLTITEYRLLVALVQAEGRVLTRNQLIDKAIGTDAIVTDRTIDVHLTALRGKLGPGREMIQTVRGIGYRLVESGV